MIGNFLLNFVLITGTLFGLLIYLFVPAPFWIFGSGIVLALWTVLMFAITPFKPLATRGRWALVAAYIILATLIISAVTFFLGTDPIPVQVREGNFDAMPFLQFREYSTAIDPRHIAIFIGLIAAFPLTLIVFVVIGYLSSIYALALHEDDLSFGDAFRSFLYLIFDVQLSWLLVENGETIELKTKGFVNKWLSRGKIIVKPGNAVVLERGGNITGIHGPGIVLTVKDEMIRQVFDLRPQFASHELENVITSDRIPLKIKLSVGYRITPSSRLDPEPKNGGAVIYKEKRYGLFPVEETTLLKAAFNTTSGGWTAFGTNICVGQLRDQMMAQKFNEIFEIANDNQDISVRVNERRIKHIETAIMDAVNSFADANMGVTIFSVDIGEISFPDDVKEAIELRIKSEAEAEAIGRIETTRNTARGNMVDSILNSISGHTNQEIGDDELKLAAIFAYISRRALTDDVLGREYVKVLEKLASADGTKIFNATPSHASIDPFDRISLPTPNVALSSNGNGKNS